MNERACQGNLLCHACRVVGDELLSGLGEVEGGEQLLGALAGGVGVEAAKHRDVDQKVRAREAVEEPHPIRHDAEEASRTIGFLPHVNPVHERGAAVGGEQARGHRQRRCLASTVGADDPVEGTGRNVEREVGNRDEVAVDLDESSDRQGDIIADGCGG